MTVLADAKVLEGTWEEIAEYADDLKGHRLIVTVLSANGTNSNGAARVEKEETLAEALARVGTIDGPPTDMGARDEEYFGKIMDDKYRREQEKLEQSP